MTPLAVSMDPLKKPLNAASHTFLRLGTLKFIETNPPGTLYVYLNYGVHWLLSCARVTHLRAPAFHHR
jgi:3-methyladenine DNA glycosylase Mpg